MGRLSERKKTGLYVGAILLGILLWAAAAFAQEENVIEQVYINMPDVTVYYRTGSDQVAEAFLGGQKLTCKADNVFGEVSGEEGIDYYYLVDISGSIYDSRFEDIKRALIEFRKNQGPKDRLLLYTFGDQVSLVLTGDEDEQKAEEVITGLSADDQNTVLFDALTRAGNDIVAAWDRDQKRRVMFVISDGKDFSDDTRYADSVKEDLIRKGVPVYTIAVENNEGDSEDRVKDYRSKFSSMATDTGGAAWVARSQESSVAEGLQQDRDIIQNTMRVIYRADSNVPTNKTEELLLKFGDNTEKTKAVVVSRYIADEKAPEILDIRPKEKNSFLVTFSEKVENSENEKNYEVKKGDEDLEVQRVVFAGTEENPYAVELILKQDLENGSYALSFYNITDASYEKNALKDTVREVEVRDLPQEAPSDPSAEAEGTQTPAAEEEGQSTESPAEGTSVISAEADIERGFLITFAEEVSNAGDKNNYSVSRDGEEREVSKVLSEEKDGARYYVVKLKDGLENGEYKIKVSGLTDAAGNALPEEENTILVDTIVPTATVEQSGEDGFLVTYSEEMENADEADKYTVSQEGDGKTVSELVDQGGNQYLVKLEKGLKNKAYTITLSGDIVSKSAGKAPELSEYSVTVSGVSTGISDFLENWWPAVAVVAAAVVVLIIILVVLMRKKKAEEEKRRLEEEQRREEEARRKADWL